MHWSAHVAEALSVLFRRVNIFQRSCSHDAGGWLVGNHQENRVVTLWSSINWHLGCPIPEEGMHPPERGCEDLFLILYWGTISIGTAAELSLPSPGGQKSEGCAGLVLELHICGVVYWDVTGQGSTRSGILVCKQVMIQQGAVFCYVSRSWFNNERYFDM